LEHDRRAHYGRELAARARREHDRVAVEDVVDGEDLRAAPDGEADAAHLLGGEQPDALGVVEDVQAGTRVERAHTAWSRGRGRGRQGPSALPARDGPKYRPRGERRSRAGARA